MKHYIQTILFFVIVQTFAYANAPKPVDFVDPKKFSGLWYELARTYNSFEKDCVGSTVEYTPTSKLVYSVKNRCFEKDFSSKTIEYNGTAVPLDGNNFSQIKKTYFWIFSSTYRLIYLNDNYTLAIMTDEEMEHVWIMSRKAIIKKEKLEKLTIWLSNYMNINRLIYTPQKPQGDTNESR
ncbi:MAG: lipocalin family protein [Halarcobacter sp.]